MSKFCKISTEHPDLYTDWRDAFLSGSLVTINPDYSVSEINAYEEFLTREISDNGYTLSKSDKYSMVTSILGGLTVAEKDTVLPSGKRVEDALTELKNSFKLGAGNKAPMKAVTNPHLSAEVGQKIKRPLDTQSELSQFIPVVSPRVNHFIIDFLYSKFKELCLWHEDGDQSVIVSSDSDLTLAIESYKRSLIDILQKYCNYHNEISTGESLITQETIDNYNELMNLTWNKIKGLVEVNNGEIDIEVTSESILTVVNPIMAFYVLQNFDKVINQILSDFVVVDARYINSLESDSEKYKQKNRKKNNASWNDDVHSSNAENIEDKLLTTFVTGTVDEITKLPLSKDFVETMVVTFKNYVENIGEIPEIIEILTNDSIPSREKITTLINFLKAPTNASGLKELSQVGYSSCRSLGERLDQYMKAYDKKYEKASSKDREYMDLKQNVGVKLLNAFNKGVLEYVQIKENSNTSHLQAGSKKKSKEYVRSRIRKALLNRLSETNGYRQFEEGLIIGNTYADYIVQIDSDNIVNYLSYITGINFRDDEFRERMHRHIPDLMRFVRKYRRIVRNHLSESNLETKVQNILDELSWDTDYITFSDIVINENQYTLERIFSLDGDEQPKTTITTVTTQQARRIKQFEDEIGSDNILLANGSELIKQTRKKLSDDKIISKGDFIQHIGYAGDVHTAKGNKRWVALNEKEIAEAWLNSLYLRSVVNSNIASFQIDAASDKVKVPIGHINLDNKIGEELLSGSIDSLVDKCFAQHTSYYNKVEHMVLDRWSALLGQKFVSLSDLSSYLSTNPITVESVSDLIRNVQKSNKDFIFQNQIDYVISNGTLTLNNSLLKEIARGKSRQAWLEGTQKAYEQFTVNISKYNPQIDLRGLSELKEEQKLRFCLLFGINTEEELKTKTIHGIFTELLTQLRQKPYFAQHSEFLKRFYYMYNLIREADLELFQKHYWTHADNKSDIFEEETNRINKGKKRNNALSATWSPLAQGLTYGVPARIRTATIESMTTPVVNNFGDVETLNAHDGAIYSSYIMRLLERASSPDIHMADTTKIIALCPEGAGFEQIKCADYSMTNDWIMGSVKQSSGNPQFMDGHMLMKKMLSPAVLSVTFYNALYKRLLYGNLNTGLLNVIFTFNGRKAILKEFFPDVNNRGLSATWQYLDYDSDLTDEENTVPMEVVAKTLGLELDPELEILRVENLYDLWKFFGAEYSESNSEEGIDFSNISQEMVTTLMCEFDPSLKEQMIGKIIDIQASKSTQHWMNTRKEVFTEGVDLITGYLDTVQYGAQQDYSHLSEEDTVSSLTQVIGAVALNGENSELAQELYQLLGKITADALQEITVIYADTNKDAFYKKLGKELANSLKSNKVVSNAEVILKEALKKIGNSDQFFSTKALPISTNQLYHLVTSELLTKLNRIIRQRFSGMAVVQNPAQGIIGLYQDNQGNVFTKRFLVKKAQEWGAKQILIPQTIDDLVASYIKSSEQFKPIQLDATNVHFLNIGHVVKINGKEIFHIQSPQDLVRVHELVVQGVTVEQIFNVPRNLATTQISWNDATTGEGMNMWLMKSTQELIKEQAANRKLAKANLSVPKLSVVKDWHNANMRGLAKKINPYYYKTLEDYKTGIITSVVNLKYQAGEEVLPKQYRTKLGLSEDLGYILEQQEKYFESLLQSRYQLSDDINLQAYNDVEHLNTFALATNYFDVVFTDSAIEIDNNSFTEVYNGKLKVLDETGEEIPNLILPNIPCDVQYSKRNNKDLIVVKVPEGYFNNPAQYLAYVKQVLSEIKHNTINTAARQNADAPGAFWQTDPEIQTYLKISKNNQKPLKIKEEAVKTYNSFLLSLQTISARIPSQSFQSFLSNHTVAFTKTADNDGYMNIWEMWFLGSDYDIDKAYTLIYALDACGQIPGNIFTDYSSPETIFDSLLLPNPDKNIQLRHVSEIEKGTSGFDITQTLAQYMGGLLTAEQVLKTLKANKGQVFIYTDENLANAALKFNNYNMSEYSSDYYKNKVMAAIRYASQDLKNLKASQVPMEAKYVNDCIKRSVEEYGTSNGVKYFNEDPTHIINFQYQAAIGKEGVGISANSIKVVGTVQQRHNIKHAEESDGKRLVVPDLQIDLEFPLLGKDGLEKRRVTEMIRKMPNTKLSFDLFKQYFTEKDLLNHPFNELYQKLQKKQEIIDPSSKQQRFIDAYKLSADKSFLSVLYKMYENEENVADMLSVFISLCTDNAKELALYKIAGVPELLNLPLAMISLGMEMQDITDICVAYLLPVLDKLNVSSIQQSHQTNILLIFADLGKNNHSMKAGYDSLVKIYEAAQEMKLIAGYFKINQGTSVTYSEVLSFLDRLDRKIKDSGLMYDGQVVKFRDFFKENSEDLKKYAVHFYEYGDANHEAPKTAFNIFDIILNSPHFYEQLKATNSIVDHIQSISGLAHIAAKLYSQNNANNKANPTRITQIVQNALISNSLKQMSDITFDKAATLTKFGQWSPELGLSTQIGISDFTKIDHFINFIQEAVVPYLKHNFKDNFFVQLLDVNNRTGFYELPFRSYEVRGDIRTKTDINKAQLAFYQIAALQSGLRTLNGTPITIGDLMYMYSVITTQNRTNTTTTVMYNGMNKFTQLNFDLRLHEYYAEVDRITGIATLPLEVVGGNSAEYENAKERLQLLIDQIDPYVKAEYNNGSYTNGNIKYTVNTERVLYTMYPGEAVSELGISQESLYQFINQVLTNNNSGAIVEEKSIAIQGNSLTFKLRIPNKIGQVETRVVKLHNLALTSDKSISQTALREIQKLLSQNIVPTYQVLAQLQLYSTSNPTLYNNQKLSTIEELKPYIGIKSLKNNDLYKSMLDWMNKEQDIIVISGDSYIKSHVEKIGNTNTVVINNYDFVGKADDEKLITLLNLFVDSQLDGMPSENKRFNFLLKSVLKVKGVTGTIELAVQNKEVLKLIGENKLIEKWYHQLINDSEINDIRQTAAAGMVQFQRALRDPDLYYYDYDSNNKGQNLPGDIFENIIDKQTYIFLGYTPTGKYIFVNTNPEAENKVQPFSEVTTNKNYKRVKRCKTHINYSLTDTYKDVNHTNLGNYKETMRLQVGDRIIRSDRAFYISDVLYTFNENGYTVEYVVTTDDQKRILLTPNAKDVIEKLNVQEIVANKTVNSSDVSGASTEFKSRLLNVLGVGVQVSINGNNYIIKQLLNDLIVTTDNQLLNVSDVTEIQIAELLLTKVDPFYGLLLQTDKIIIDKIDLPLIRTAPLFRDVIQNTKSVNDKTLSFTARTAINGQLFHNFDLPHNVVKMGLVTDEVETGDYILRYKSDNNTYSCYHVLEVNGENAVVLECNQSDEVNRQSAIKTVSISKELLGGQLYKHESNLEKKRIVSRTDKHVSNPNDQVYQFMDRLASMFGTRVEIINDTQSSVLAQVKDGLIVINIAKKPEAQSVVDYLLEQSIHEFSHLAVLALRANDPEQYLKLIQLITKDLSLSGKFYTNYILQQEETLVRFLTDKIKGDAGIFDREIYDIYKSAFESLFGEEGMISEDSYADTASTAKYGDFTRSIQDAFQKMSWLKENVRLSTLREKALSDEVLEKIDIICK